MAHRHAGEQGDGFVLGIGVDIAVRSDNRSARVPCVLVQVAVAGPEGGARKVQRRLDLETFLVGCHVVVDGPFFELNDSADHIPELVLEASDLQRKQCGIHRELAKITYFTGSYALFLQVFVKS